MYLQLFNSKNYLPYTSTLPCMSTTFIHDYSRMVSVQSFLAEDVHLLQMCVVLSRAHHHLSLVHMHLFGYAHYTHHV